MRRRRYYSPSELQDRGVEFNFEDIYKLRDLCFEKLGRKRIYIERRPRHARIGATIYKRTDEDGEYFVIWFVQFNLETTAHELAHAWEWDDGHGYQWHNLKNTIKSYWKEKKGELT